MKIKFRFSCFFYQKCFPLLELLLLSLVPVGYRAEVAADSGIHFRFCPALHFSTPFVWVWICELDASRPSVRLAETSFFVA